MLLGALAGPAGPHHLPLEQRADTGPMLQEHLHQSDLLRRQQEPRPPQQEERYPETAPPSYGHDPDFSSLQEGNKAALIINKTPN